MKEEDYVVATNLAKVRVAIEIIKDLNVGGNFERIQRIVLSKLTQIEISCIRNLKIEKIE